MVKNREKSSETGSPKRLKKPWGLNRCKESEEILKDLGIFQGANEVQRI